MKSMFTIALMVVLASGTALADHRECKVSVGKIRPSTCAKFTGTAVVAVDGDYKQCKIERGQIRKSTCKGKFINGSVVVDD